MHDLERIVPDALDQCDPLDSQSLALHIERYRFAAGWAPGARVLDIACGVGYGSSLLRDAGATEVIGVDHDPDAIAYAVARYGNDGVSFVVADAMLYSEPQPFDLVVSLETVEHLAHPARFVRRLASALRPGGVLVASVPTTPSKDVNPYHLHDFRADELEQMYTDAGLEIVSRLVQSQRYSPLRVLKSGRGSEGRSYSIRKGLLRHYLLRPHLLIRRAITTLRHGFRNEYVVLAGIRPVGRGDSPRRESRA